MAVAVSRTTFSVSDSVDINRGCYTQSAFESRREYDDGARSRVGGPVMPSLFETLTQSLGSNELGQLGRQIGADQASTSTAVATALPMLIGALAHKASQPQGAQAIAGALARDHDGSILDNIQDYL